MMQINFSFLLIYLFKSDSRSITEIKGKKKHCNMKPKVFKKSN